MTMDLFEALEETETRTEVLGPGARVLRGLARPQEAELLAGVRSVIEQAPLRHMVTPGGQRMSVAMTNCGPLGWISDRRGYRYAGTDPLSDQPWPPLPETFLHLAANAAAQAGFDAFVPDACLINRYEPGSRLSLHQDWNENELDHPIVSVSLGIHAVFQFGGAKRTDKAQRVPLEHGDVVVWGGPDRMRFHGVLPLKEAEHRLLGACRINLTFRKAG